MFENSRSETGVDDALRETLLQEWNRFLQMDREKRTEWSTSNLSFTCQACAFNNRPGQAMHRRYNARAALSRLETAFNSGESAMCDAARSERLLLQTYGITLPPSKPSAPTGPVDDISQIILQQYDPTVLESYQSLALAPDGNCFYRGLSRALYSHENCHVLFRVLVILEMVEHRSYYDKRAPDFVDLINDGTLVEADYNRELGRAVRHTCSASFVNMLAGSAVLQLTYKSYCPPTVSPRHISIPYTRLVRGRGVLTDRPAFTLMWTMCAIPPTHADFQPNHFNVLRSNSAANQTDEWSSLPSTAGAPKLPLGSPMPPPSSAAHQTDEWSSLPVSSPMPPPSTTTPQQSKTPSVRAIGGKDLPGPQRDFLDVDTLVHELRACNEPQEHIPRGVKENVYFLVNNSENEDRHLAGKRSEYWDDCGAWSSRSSGVIAHFLSQPVDTS
ncbi:Hypp9423 [Branchiostoma lanceolatum]|uniref:Hypp9423 protein n=1 Tax=Branchiostoma lanceolatum TaxID=7740 RepID=A0A8S4MMU2_BRALA|nr:Hypp9423 [Branchiostoma lanceolatum]